jgi:hypothetical protein
MAVLQPKRLKSKDPRLAKKYIKQVKLKMKTRGFQARFDAFKMKVTPDWNNMMQAEYNWLQNENAAICKEVESKLQKLFMGGISWSPEIQIVRDKIEAWSILVHKKKDVQVNSVKCIRHFLKKVPSIKNAFTCTLPEALQCRHLAFREYQSGRKLDALNWRDTFQGTLAEAIVFKKGTDGKTEAKNLRRIEQQRHQARNVKRMRGEMNYNRVNKLWYTEVDGTRVQCNTQATMEYACFAENETRFSQTENALPMLELMVTELGSLGESDQIECILAGNYQALPGTDRYMKELLAEMRMPRTIQTTVAKEGTISKEILVDENRAGWKKRRVASAESTGLTMDHYYVVGGEDPKLNEIDTQMHQLPYRFGFSPNSWQKITDMEILKKIGVYDVERMQTIQLMHAEFNMNNKKMGHDVKWFAESHKVLAPEQFGSRKNHQSILAALNKQLTMDILPQRRKARALCVNDDKSCYDRIEYSVATLALRKLCHLSQSTPCFRLFRRPTITSVLPLGSLLKVMGGAVNHLYKVSDTYCHNFGYGNPGSWI